LHGFDHGFVFELDAMKIRARAHRESRDASRMYERDETRVQSTASGRMTLSERPTDRNSTSSRGKRKK
jgi:hypothetical protein